MDQAHADESPVVIDALDCVSVHLELPDDRGGEVNPAGSQLGKSQARGYCTPSVAGSSSANARSTISTSRAFGA
jgi:hypothetical protein